MRPIRLLLQSLDHFKRGFFWVFVVGLLDTFVGFQIPVTLARFTKESFNFDRFQTLVALLFLLYLTSISLQWVIRKFGEALGPKLSVYLRMKYFAELASRPVENLTRHHSGYILALIQAVCDGLGGLSTEILWGVTRSFLNILLFFYYTSLESVSASVFNGIVLIVFLSISISLSRKMVPLVSNVNEARATLLEHYVDFMTNVLTVRKLGVYPFARSKLESQTESTYDSIQEVQTFHANRWFKLHGLFGLAFVTTMAMLLNKIALGESTPSILILFIATFSTIRGNVERLSENFKTLFELTAYIENLDDVLGKDASIAKGRTVEDWKEIELKDVKFTYPKSSLEMQIPSFVLRKGDKIYVSGSSGQGKTTLLNIAANFLSPAAGSVSIDGIPYKELHPNALGGIVAYVSQEVELFNLSLRENLCLGATIDDQTLVSHLQSLGLSDLIDGGLDSKIGEKGLRISAGQKQRINLLRAIILNREIYLLDEPTSHLDSETEKLVISELGRFLATKTAIIVSHKSSVRALCSREYNFTGHRLLVKEI